MYISMLTSLFDKELIDKAKQVKINNIKYKYLYQKHINLIQKCSINKLFKS